MRLAVVWAIVFSMMPMAWADVTTIDMRRAPETIGFHLEILPGGAMLIDVDGEPYRIESRFSYPHMKGDAWNRLADKVDTGVKWHVRVESGPDSAVHYVRAACKFYRLERRIEVLSDRIAVRDTLTNMSGKDLAIAFDHRFHPQAAPKRVYITGWNRDFVHPDQAAHDDVTPINTTIYIGGARHGLGVLTEDDFFRLQGVYGKDGRDVVIRNRSFALPPKDSYTFEWSVIPTAANDYYEFINQARRIMDVNFTLDGPFVFTFGGTGLNTTSSAEQLHNYEKCLGVKMIAAPDVWLGGVSGYEKGGREGNLYHPEKYLDDLTAWTKTVHETLPGVKVVAKIQTTYCGPWQKPGSDIPFQDSTIIEPDGSRKGAKTGVYHHYPASGNSYNSYLRKLITRVLQDNKACDGIYFDTFSYNYWSKYGRWTYDRWDRRSVDIDPATWTIKARKADLCMISEQARYELVKLVRDLGGIVQINHSILTKKMRTLHINAFQEYRNPVDLVRLHLTAPVTLGYYPGYRDRSRWKDEADLFDDVRQHLRWGVLTQIYFVTPVVAQPTIYKRMYPITPVRIGPGYVIGKERIVTLLSGVYTVGTAQEPMVWFYDAKGHECDGEKQTLMENGQAYVQITVPANGAAVIAAPPSVREALRREVGGLW